MYLFSAFITVLLTRAALAASQLQGNASTSELQARDDSDCKWEDAWGVWDCNTYLITLGAYRNFKNPHSPDYIDWHKSYVIIRNHQFLVANDLFCGEKKKGDHGAWQNFWTTFEHPDLPVPIKIHSGHACTEDDPDNNWDNVWIEWKDQHLDVPSDNRCYAPCMADLDCRAGFVNCYITI